MRFGIWPSPNWSWEEIHELAAHCERTGWDAVYFADHFMPNAQGDQPMDGDTIECWSVLAALAATIPRVRLAPLVTSITYRHPAVLANIAAATDLISGGRLTLGLGAGWQLNEHAAYGLELGPPRERLDRFEEAVTIIRSLLRDRRTSFEGRYYKIGDAPNQPAPVQPEIPILIGGGGEKRMLGIVARLADEWNTWTTPDVLEHKVGVLEERCAAIGRDRRQIRVSTQALTFLSTDDKWLETIRGAGIGRAAAIGTPSQMVDLMAEYRDAGADEYIVPGFTMDDRARRQDICDMFIEEVAPAFR